MPAVAGFNRPLACYSIIGDLRPPQGPKPPLRSRYRYLSPD